MVIARNRSYFLFAIIFLLALTKGVAEIFNVPIYILILLPVLFVSITDVRLGLLLPKFVVYRLTLGLFIAGHGGNWDYIIGFTYLLTGLILSLVYTYALRENLSNGSYLVQRLFKAYTVVLFIAYLVSSDSVFVLDRGIDLRFAGFAGDPNFLAIVSMLVLYGLFKKGPFTFVSLIVILMLTQSRSALIVLAVLILYSLRNGLGKFVLPVLLGVGLGILLMSNTDVFNTVIVKLRLDKLASQSRATNLWFPVLNTIDFTDWLFWLVGKGSHYSKNILGVYLHSSWIEIFVEYGVIGMTLAVLELKSLWKVLRTELARLMLISFVIVNMLFSVHWGVFSLCILALSIVVDRNEIYN